MFALAVAAMAIGLNTGMELGLGTVPRPWAGWVNGALLLQFPALHSLLLNGRGRRLLTKIVPQGKRLAPTTFALIASLQVLATFLLWTPSHGEWWRPQGPWLAATSILNLGAWLFLGKALWDAGLGLQTGWIGWRAVHQGRNPSYPGLPQHGLFARCRQPIYLGFGLTLWTGPVWNADHLAIALTWTTYCLLGPILKERRFALQYGDAFAAYRQRVPYLLPRIRS